MYARQHILRATIGAAVVGMLIFAIAALSGGPSDTSTSTSVQPTAGPDYDAAMQRCAISRLSNGGDPAPSTDSGAYLDAYTACTYGRSYDHVTAPARGWGAADPGYWTP